MSSLKLDNAKQVIRVAPTTSCKDKEQETAAQENNSIGFSGLFNNI